jgi:hypothetical protein
MFEERFDRLFFPAFPHKFQTISFLNQPFNPSSSPSNSQVITSPPYKYGRNCRKCDSCMSALTASPQWNYQKYINIIMYTKSRASLTDRKIIVSWLTKNKILHENVIWPAQRGTLFNDIHHVAWYFHIKILHKIQYKPSESLKGNYSAVVLYNKHIFHNPYSYI